MAVDELDDVIAQVHAMLDERIARERADDIQARHAGLEGRRQLGKGLAVGAGEFDAHRLDKGTRRHRPQPRDDGVASYALIAVGGFQRQPALLDQLGLRLDRSEEHTSELQSLMRISYAVFCLKKKKVISRKVL